MRSAMRRLAAASTVLCVIGVACTTPLLVEPVASGMLPNIVLILLDDADKLAVEKMPNIDSLIAQQGVSFDRFYVTESLCCPSRASLLTGRYVHNHGIFTNRAEDGGGFDGFRRKGHERRTIARRLKAKGYATALVGKYFNGYGPDTTYRPPFWSRWFATFEDDYYNYPVNDNGRVVTYGDHPTSYSTNVFARVVRRFIDRHEAERPFFALASFTAPHQPATNPPRHKNEFSDERPPSFDKPSFSEQDVSDKPAQIRERPRVSAKQKRAIAVRYRQRLRMLLAVDDFVERLVSDLSASGQLANTYIAVTSDNGWMQGEHRILKEKGHPYEESVKVPLIIRGPGIPAGVRSQELVSMVDLFATFDDIGGGAELRDGRSLLPLLDGSATGWRDRLLIEKRKYDVIVTGQHKYIRRATGERELYDLNADPSEVSSLHRTADPSLLADLNEKLFALKRCRGPSCRVADGGPSG